MGHAARIFEPTSPAADRLAALMALPLRAEPATEEEGAIFEQMEAERLTGHGGHGAEEIRATIERMPYDQGE